MLEYRLAPSVLAADFTRLGEDVSAVEAAGAQYLHLDVMDGNFVPSISIGMPVIESLRKKSGLIFDVHLMIQKPDRYLKAFADAGADILTVHEESTCHLDRTLREIRDVGCRVGVALNPATPWENIKWVLPEIDMVLLMTVNPGFGGQPYISYVTEKIITLRRWLTERGLSTDIEVDGGITLSNAEEIMRAGANVLVAGSAVYRGDAAANVRAFRSIMDRMQEEERE